MGLLYSGDIVVISKRIWNSDQSWHYESIEKIGGRKAKLYVCKNAYVQQSYAVVEIWANDAWQRVHRVPGVELQTEASYVQKKGVVEANFAKDLDELRSVFLAVVA